MFVRGVIMLHDSARLHVFRTALYVSEGIGPSLTHKISGSYGSEGVDIGLHFSFEDGDSIFF